MEPEAGAQLGSDAELITRVRVGDTAAFGELYRRHAGAATALARQVARSPAEADDLVSESFARVLDGLKAGGGPDTAFRAYLFTTLRHTAYDRTRKDSRLTFTDDIEAHETAVDGPDPVIAMAENGMVGKAFAGLPERWQAVLWHTQVEGMSPAETGVLLGMSANAVTSLAFRAREGLREAYLQAHLAETAQEQCRWTTDRLGAWARGGLSKREQATVDAHLQSCEHCAALAAELAEINSSLRGILAPLLLGGLATGYLATLGPVGTLTQAGVLVGAGSAAGTAAAGTTGAATGGATGAVTGAAAGGTAGAHAAGGASWFSKPWAAVGTGVAAAAVAVTVAVIVATAGGSSPTNSADAGPQTAAVGTGITGGTGPGGTGPGGTGTGGTGGPGGTAGTDANGTDGPGPGSDDPGANGSEGDGTGTNGTDADGTNGNTPNDGATGNQTGGTDQPGSNDQPGTNDQPGNADGPPGETTPPGQGGAPTTAPNNVTPSPVATTTNGQGSTQQPTSPSTQQTPAPTTRTSAPTPAPPTTQAPTTRTTSPTTPTTRPSTPTTRPSTPTVPTTPTTTPPPSPNVSISVGAFSALAGGAIAVQVDADNSLGTDASAGGTVVVSASGVTVGGSASGLRARTSLAFAPADAIVDCSVAVEATNCSLPAVSAGGTLHTSFILTVGLDAEPGSLVVSWGPAFSKTVEFDIEAGITGITVVDGPKSLPVGRPAPITLAPILADGVTEAGPITVPIKSGGIWITQYPDTCTESAGLLTCQPVVGEKDDITYGPITVTVMPGADPDDSLSVTVPNGDESGITIIGGDTGIKIEPWDPGTGVVDWTGPFGGETVGAETMRCSVRNLERDLCRIGRRTLMTDIDPAKEPAYQQSLSTPEGADLLVAQLTWVGSAPAAGGSLDTAQLVVRRGDQTTTTAVKGTAVACAEKGPCPTIRSADVTALLAGADAVWLEPLAAARLTVGGLSPMAGWSVNLVWMDPHADTAHVSIDDAIRSSLSGRQEPDLVALVGESDADLQQLSGAVWAADPWAVKRILVSGKARTPSDRFLGLDSSRRTTGFDLFDLAGSDLAGSADGVTLSNRATLPTLFRQDQVWIGPLLVVRSSQPPAS